MIKFILVKTSSLILIREECILVVRQYNENFEVQTTTGLVYLVKYNDWIKYQYDKGRSD